MWVNAGVAQQPLDNAAVLHIRRQKTQRHLRDLGPGHCLAIAEWCVGGDQKSVALVIEGNCGHAAERFSR